MLPTPNCRCRSIGSCRTLPGPRDTPAASRHQHQALYRGPLGVLRGPRRSPAKRVRWGKEEQGSERNFRRQAEMKLSGLCDDARQRKLGVGSVGLPQRRKEDGALPYPAPP